MKLHCDIILPASKSESNRALMIAAYGGFALDFRNLSESNDTHILMEVLRGLSSIDSNRTAFARKCSAFDGVNDIGGNSHIIDIADCGTAARFLATFLACHEGDWLLTGTERMKRRPMEPLVDTLRVLGADIQYVEQVGLLPLRIKGKLLLGGKVAVDMTQSSQFASSLLLAAPIWPQGLELELLGKLNSEPYLDMTIALMRQFGAEVERKGNMICVAPKPYRPTEFEVSADWSAASYWYEAAALSDLCTIRLHGLDLPSLQGDAVIRKWMELVGVMTNKDGDTLCLTKKPFEKQNLSFDFSLAPDLFPTMAATCAGLSIEACFTGITNLIEKESDRIDSMGIELAKIGVVLERVSSDVVVLKPASVLPCFRKSAPLMIDVHGDHRVAMAMAPLSMKVGTLSFNYPEVVGKSYPNFWKNMSVMLDV